MPNRLILAGQNETVRRYVEEQISLGTLGLMTCVGCSIDDQKGNVSLTHCDSETNLEFIDRELGWLKEQSDGKPIVTIVPGIDANSDAVEKIKKHTRRILPGVKVQVKKKANTFRFGVNPGKVRDIDFTLHKETMFALCVDESYCNDALFQIRTQERFFTKAFDLENTICTSHVTYDRGWANPFPSHLTDAARSRLEELGEMRDLPNAEEAIANSIGADPRTLNPEAGLNILLILNTYWSAQQEVSHQR